MQDIKISLVLVTTLLASLAHAHSWLEALSLLSPNGSFTGKTGYPRGMILRTDPDFHDQNMQWQLPPAGLSNLTNDMAMCRPSQSTSNYTDSNLPKLQAYPGANIALRYQENGHVTVPWAKAGKPTNSGVVYVYGTSEPREDDTFLGIHGQWTLDGKGGDGRGRLLTSQYFDDGQCYQINIGYISAQRQTEFHRVAEAGSFQGGNLWCQTDVPLPKDLPDGKDYTLYWVWDWSTMDGSGKVTLPEYYTTCSDVTIADTKAVGDTGAIIPGGNDSASVAFVSVTNYGEAAISSVFESLASTMTVPPASSTVPVNITAFVSYTVAADLLALNLPSSVAASAGSSSAAAFLASVGSITNADEGASLAAELVKTRVPIKNPAIATAAATSATAASVTAASASSGAAAAVAPTSAPAAATATSAPTSSLTPSTAPASAADNSGTSGCSAGTETVTVTMTITSTVASQLQARATGSFARRRNHASIDDDDDDDDDDSRNS